MPFAALSTAPSVQIDGLSWGGVASWGSFLALLGIIVRQINPWRKQTMDAEQQLRNDLLKRVTDLERSRDRQEARHAAERALDRHKINNLTQCFDAMVFGLETAGADKVPEVVAKVKEMRRAQIVAEAEEKGAIHAAEIAAAGEHEH